jgi:hypothetical protein
MKCKTLNQWFSLKKKIEVSKIDWWGVFKHIDITVRRIHWSESIPIAIYVYTVLHIHQAPYDQISTGKGQSQKHKHLS